MIDKPLHVVYIALGSNLGERAANLETARRHMSGEIELLAWSPVYETPPWGYADQPAFLNQVAKGNTHLQPVELLDFLKRIENLMGRQKTIHNGPRVIDLDLLFYDELSMESPKLTIPHPRMRGRAFVLKPLADLAEELVHPLLGLTIGELLAETDQSGIVLYSPGDGSSAPTTS